VEWLRMVSGRFACSYLVSPYVMHTLAGSVYDGPGMQVREAPYRADSTVQRMRETLLDEYGCTSVPRGFQACARPLDLRPRDYVGTEEGRLRGRRVPRKAPI
jgi:hypothetical protein